ncbi:MAG: 50S ribosomal protein L6 [Acetanaerobacterium sp.]
MSRIGKREIDIPQGVDVKINGSTVTVKGPKGTLESSFKPSMKIELKDGKLTVVRPSDSKEHKSLHGLTRTLIANMVKGTHEGFTKELEINGVGYRAAKQGTNLVMTLGYSHQVIMPEGNGITIEVPAPNRIVVRGSDKQAVGQFAAEIREKRPPEPYKGKGIKYANEVILRKEGKAGKGGKK